MSIDYPNPDCSLIELLQHHTLVLSNGVSLYSGRAYTYMHMNELDQFSSNEKNSSSDKRIEVLELFSNVKNPSWLRSVNLKERSDSFIFIAHAIFDLYKSVGRFGLISFKNIFSFLPEILESKYQINKTEDILTKYMPSMNEYLMTQASAAKVLYDMNVIIENLTKTIKVFNSSEHNFGPETTVSTIEKSFALDCEETLNNYFIDVSRSPNLNKDAINYLEAVIVKDLRILHSNLKDRY